MKTDEDSGCWGVWENVTHPVFSEAQAFMHVFNEVQAFMHVRFVHSDRRVRLVFKFALILITRSDAIVWNKVLGVCVFFAIKQAVLAARKDLGSDDWFDMPSPATVQVIQQKCTPEGWTAEDALGERTGRSDDAAGQRRQTYIL